MFFNLRVFLWTIVAELEYYLYPWKEEKPSEDVIRRYNLPESSIEKDFQYDWIQSHDQKISRLQEEMIWVQTEIHKINIQMETND